MYVVMPPHVARVAASLLEALISYARREGELTPEQLEDVTKAETVLKDYKAKVERLQP